MSTTPFSGLSVGQLAIQVLDLTVNDDHEGHYRLLVDKMVKYVDVEGDVYGDIDDMCCEDDLIPLLPIFPRGEWNKGLISRNVNDGSPYFSVTETVNLPAVTELWHPVILDLLTLELEWKSPRPVHRVLQPVAGLPAMAKYANWPHMIQSVQDETTAYSWLQDQDVCPQFLGHLTENGRVTGFLVEQIIGRHAGPEDLEACRETLGKLHRLGIRHGDINRFNFIIQEKDGRAILFDLATARKCDDQRALADEMMLLEKMLNDTSFRGGIRRLD